MPGHTSPPDHAAAPQTTDNARSADNAAKPQLRGFRHPTQRSHHPLPLATRLLHEAHVVPVPGEAFGTAEHIRISYPVTKQNIDEGTRRMGEFLGKLK